MKKFLIIFISIFLCLPLCACHNSESTINSNVNDDNTSIGISSEDSVDFDDRIDIEIPNYDYRKNKIDVNDDIRAKVEDSYKAYFNIGNRVLNLEFYGAFDGIFVIYDVYKAAYSLLIDEIVDEVIIHYSNSTKMLVYSSDKFYELNEAFELNLITYDNLITICENFNDSVTFVEK